MKISSQSQRISKLAVSRKQLQACVLITLAVASADTLARKATKQTTDAMSNVKIEMVGNETSCAGKVSSPAKLTLPLGKSTVINLPEPLASRSVGDQGVLQAKMIAPQTLYLLGMNIGTTNMIIQGKSGSCTIIDVSVGMDPDALQQTLTELLPEEKNIKVVAAADSLILTGSVEDALTANRAVDIASAYVRRMVMPVQRGEAQTGNQNQNQNQNQGGGQNRNTDIVNPRIINMLSVSAQQQVMLEVKIAEISKTLLDRLGIDFAAAKINGNSSFFYNILPSILTGGTPTTNGTIVPRFAESPNVTATTGSGDSFRGLLLDAEKRDGLVKILAEPSIMAISGQEGSFLAGGRIFIPVAQNNNGGGTTITLEEKEFGVGVKFTPTVLSGGRINLKVAPEVSELNREGVGITATGISGTAILPSFTSRKASTTVQLMDGQSFAIGGLIKNNTTANIKAFPVLGELPIIGALFRSTDFQKDKTELVFVVTPRLVKPLAARDVRLPTDGYTDPSRSDIFLNGKLEGPAPVVLPSDDASGVIYSPPASTSSSQVKSTTVKPTAVKPVSPAATTGFDLE
ncbi:MAG TPA: type II and III secretion system protein family protein [Methylophilus sp.]